MRSGRQDCGGHIKITPQKRKAKPWRQRLGKFRDKPSRRLAGRAGQLKALLLNQAFVAGLGNIYADEALFAAGLHPLRRADSLADEEIARLHAAIRATLAAAIAREGASVNWYRKPDGTRGSAQVALSVYGRADQPCPRCGRPIARVVIGGRGAHFCPACQARG